MQPAVGHHRGFIAVFNAGDDRIHSDLPVGRNHLAAVGPLVFTCAEHFKAMGVFQMAPPLQGGILISCRKDSTPNDPGTTGS